MSYQFANNQAAMNTPSSFGLAPNIAALVGYLFIPWTSIAVIMTEKENRFVRFHAFQSLFMGIGLVVFTICLSVVIMVLSLIAAAISPYAGILVSVVSLIVWAIIAFVILAFWAVCLFKAYKGEKYKLPLIGNFAEKYV